MSFKRDKPRNERLRPVGLIYWLLILPAALLLRLFFFLRISKDRSVRRLKGPVILIGNHPSYMDPFIMATALLPRTVRFMATRDLFRSRFLGTMLNWLGAIPKTQFRTDTQALKSVLRTIRNDGAVAIYPEAQRSIDGSLQPVDDSLYKLIKKAGCPVVMVMTQGAYLAWPRWSRGIFRPGRIQVTVRLLLDQDTIQQSSLTAIRKQILQAMAYNDYQQQKQNRYRYHTRRPAEGMADICHQCPACGKDLAMESAARTLTCRFCGNQAVVDITGLIQPALADSGRQLNKVWPDMARWHRWQIAQLKQEMSRGTCRRTCSATLSWPYETDNHQAVQGTLDMTQQSLSFYDDGGHPDRQDAYLTIPLAHRNGITAVFGSHFDIAYADRLFRFTLEPGQAVILLVDIIQAQER